MGAGDFTPFESPAGFDPVADPPASESSTYPAALHFDASSKTYLLDGTAYKELHPIDSQMAIGLLFAQGSFLGDKTIGHTLRDVQLGQPTARLQRDVEERVRSANPVKRLLANGDVKIVSVQVGQNRRVGRLYVWTSYKNLRADGDGLGTIAAEP
jgi:hypothetical protein